MAYICTKKASCSDCPHYRYDDDRERMACWAAIDEKREEVASSSGERHG